MARNHLCSSCCCTNSFSSRSFCCVMSYFLTRTAGDPSMGSCITGFGCHISGISCDEMSLVCHPCTQLLYTASCLHVSTAADDMHTTWGCAGLCECRCILERQRYSSMKLGIIFLDLEAASQALDDGCATVAFVLQYANEASPLGISQSRVQSAITNKTGASLNICVLYYSARLRTGIARISSWQDE